GHKWIALHLFHDHSSKFHVDTTTILLNLLSQTGDDARKAVSAITITNYVKATSTPCINLLPDCRNIQKINTIGGPPAPGQRPCRRRTRDYPFAPTAPASHVILVVHHANLLSFD
ncbi:hypothetical protein KCV06_g8390, partial [Aureobasidium melanogenum]